ncbi:hypothetical protein KPL74_09350 [Bacillus sp. NP157]|nr:hypothetical protein KPL74_09350 [Bacillus sp. NP157]
MTGEVLASRGYSVLVAERFEAAMALLGGTPAVKVAVCHATLPEAGGEHASMLSELNERPEIALVVISSRPFEDVPGIPAHAIQLQKPFGANELLDAVNRAMQAGHASVR